MVGTQGSTLCPHHPRTCPIDALGSSSLPQHHGSSIWLLALVAGRVPLRLQLVHVGRQLGGMPSAQGSHLLLPLSFYRCG